MAIYKPSNHTPNLQEVDLTQENTFSCMVNTSGENIRAYKMQLLSGRGDEKIYAPETPVLLSKPVKNKNILKIDNISSSMSGLINPFENGKDYQWGVRVYNQVPNATTQPNTLVCDGFLVGSTKYVIWCKIPNQTEANKDAVDQIVYDRYIEFDTTSANMRKGAKDDVSVTIPDTLKERRKIDWVTKELGYNKNILKIETTDNFTYNYIDGTPFKIYQCSDEHTLKSFFVDPNSNINVSDYVVVFTSAAAAKAAHDVGYKPSLTEISGDADPEDDTTPHTAENIFGTPQKIIGYSSDTGEIRLGKSYSVEPENGYAYLIFEYDGIDKVCKEVTPTIEDDAEQAIKDNPYLTQVIGGREIANSLYTVMTNRWDNTAKRLFIQPNINIKSDETNPNEIVFDDGTRVDIKKQYWINEDGDKPVEVDITFDKLDNTQWLLTTDSGGLNESGQVPTVVSGTPPIIPQTDYRVYTDFMDSMPFNVFYARTSPVMEIQYRDLNKQEKVEKEGEEDEPFVYFDGVRFEEDLRQFFLVDREYETLTEEYINSDEYPNSLKEDYFPSISNNDYYNSILEMVGSYTTELVTRHKNAPDSIFDQDIETEIELLYQHYNSVGIPLRNIQFNTEFTAENGQGIKYYHYYLYAYKDQVPELIAQSEDVYSTDLIWNYRGFLSETKYSIKISVIDEYDKEFIQSFDFNIFYGTEKASAPLGVEFDCEKKAIKVTATSPEYVIPTLPNLIYLYNEDKAKVGKSIFMDAGQICYILDDWTYEVWNGKAFESSELKAITEDNIYSDENSIFDDYVEVTRDNQLYYDTVLDDSFPDTKIQIPVNFSFLTQFQITDQFIDQIPFTSENKKSKIAALGYEYFNTDKYKVEGIIVDDVVVEEVKHTLPAQPRVGDVRYLIYSRNNSVVDGYYYYGVDTDPNSETFGVSAWEKIVEVDGVLPSDSLEILNTYKNYCVLNNSFEPEIANGCYQYIDSEWVFLPQLTPEKDEKDYLDAIADIFILSDRVESTTDTEYQWLNEAWTKIEIYDNEKAIKEVALKDTTDSKTIYKMGEKYYKCTIRTYEVNKEEKKEAVLIDMTNNLRIDICDRVLPASRFIYRLQKEIEYGNIAYSIGNYIWNGYIFVNTVVEEVLDISNTTFLEGVYYYFPVDLDSSFSSELNAYFIDEKYYQNVNVEGDLGNYFLSLRDGKTYQKALLTDIFNATIAIKTLNDAEEIADAINDYVYILNNKYNEIPLTPNIEQKGTYYDGNYYNGYYLWEDGSNNEFRSLYLFLNNCKGFSYEDGILIKNDKRCYIELYDVENPDADTEPLTCFVTGETTNGQEIIANHVNLLTLGGNIPAPENYKYAIQDNENNEYQFANTLGSGPREGEKYRVYSLSEKDLAVLLEDGTGLPPTEDAAGNPYGVYTWNNEYNKWIIEPTDYGYIENVKDLIGYGLKGNAGKSYDDMTTEERYNYLSVPENCKSRISADEEITVTYSKEEIVSKPDNSKEFSDPLAVIDEDGSVVITDAGNEEDNWNFSVFANTTGGNTAVITTKKEGDLLWTDGNEIVTGILPVSPREGVVYQLIQSTDKEHPDGYYRYVSGVWEVNYDRYYYRTVDGVEGYYIWESWYDKVENKEKVTYTRLLNGTPNARNVWVDNSAYSYSQLITVINRIWLTLYLTVTYNDTNPIRCIIKAQDKWEG